MRRFGILRVAARLAAFGAVFAAASATAGPEKVAFPAYQDHVLYAVLDQPDLKVIREAYVNRAALQDWRPGRPFPGGTVFTMPVFRARVDANGDLVRDANGRLIRGTLERILVMEKRAGWGAEYPADLRNGEWEYELFRADGSRDKAADIKGCFRCHKPFAGVDFVFTVVELARFAR